MNTQRLSIQQETKTPESESSNTSITLLKKIEKYKCAGIAWIVVLLMLPVVWAASKIAAVEDKEPHKD